jgi:radical SAM superfamily enzyme YgiQ (UPF0313 family)
MNQKLSRHLALLINPWIYDFAAFDLWGFPLGLLYLSSLLKKAGWDTHYIDCTNRHHPSIADKIPHEKTFHQGKYYAELIEKPDAVRWVPRYYRRYGIPEEAFIHELEQIRRPDVILVTSRMTHWYPGVKRAIEIARKVFPGVPIILGGIYASLCPEHAQRVCKPDVLFTGEAEPHLFRLLKETTGIETSLPDDQANKDLSDLNNLPFPDFEILPSARSVPLETSRGCPLHCSYCASNKLIPKFRRKSPGRVADEIEFCAEKLGTEDFAFYDDALLFQPREHFEKIADEVMRRKIKARFHAPNGLFSSSITPSVAHKMKEMGFYTIRLSVETTNMERLKTMNRGILPSHFEEAMKNLHAAGFTKHEIGVYLIVGLPGQTVEEAREAIDFVIDHGAIPRLAEYSPIPGTREWERAVESASVDIRNEPLLHNNSVFHLIGVFNRSTLEKLKNYTLTRAIDAGLKKK